ISRVAAPAAPRAFSSTSTPYPKTFLSRIEGDSSRRRCHVLGPHCQAELDRRDGARRWDSGARGNLEDRLFSPMHWESREAIVAWYERPETRQWLERLRALSFRVPGIGTSTASGQAARRARSKPASRSFPPRLHAERRRGLVRSSRVRRTAQDFPRLH